MTSLREPDDVALNGQLPLVELLASPAASPAPDEPVQDPDDTPPHEHELDDAEESQRDP